MSNKLWTYLRSHKSLVKGWLQRVDAEIMGAILTSQNTSGIHGDCLEIGVHHGKSFLPLCLALREDEHAIAIDIFDDQQLNKDHSGEGDLVAFRRNLRKFNVSEEQVVIIQKSSDLVTPAEILELTGPQRVRYFSIDGGHWRAIVQGDLRLAESTLAHAGVIALDDYCRADWPDVTYAYSLWQDQTRSSLVPFAVGSNKLYICSRDYVQHYQASLRTSFLDSFFTKTYHTDTSPIDSFRYEQYLQDEAHLAHVFLYFLRTFYPSLYYKLRRSPRRREAASAK